MGTSAVILLYVLYNVVYSAASLPLGGLSDRIGQYPLVIAGYCVFAVVYLGFAGGRLGPGAGGPLRRLRPLHRRHRGHEQSADRARHPYGRARLGARALLHGHRPRELRRQHAGRAAVERRGAVGDVRLRGGGGRRRRRPHAARPRQGAPGARRVAGAGPCAGRRERVRCRLRVHGSTHPEGDDGQELPVLRPRQRRRRAVLLRLRRGDGLRRRTAPQGAQPGAAHRHHRAGRRGGRRGGVLVFFMRADSGTGGRRVPRPRRWRRRPPRRARTPMESFYLAAATGARANALSTVEPDGTVSQITETVGAQVFQLAWSPDGSASPASPARGTAAACGSSTLRRGRSRRWSHDAGDRLGGFRRLAQPESAPGGRLHHRAEEPGRGRRARCSYDPAMHDGVTEPLEDARRRRTPRRRRQRVADGTKIVYVTYTDQRSDQYGMATATETSRTGRPAERGGHGARLESRRSST